MKDSETYFCLASDGLLYNLGDHGAQTRHITELGE